MKKAVIFAVLTDALLPDDPRFERFLTDSRRQRLSGIHNDGARTLSLAAHIAACCAFKLLCGAPPDYAYDNGGRPISPALDIGLAHTDGAGLCIAAKFPVAVDAERLREVGEPLARRILCERERRRYGLADDKQRFLLEAWTAKECVVKLSRNGRQIRFSDITTKRFAARHKRASFRLKRFQIGADTLVCAASKKVFRCELYVLSPDEALAVLG